MQDLAAYDNANTTHDKNFMNPESHTRRSWREPEIQTTLPRTYYKLWKTAGPKHQTYPLEEKQKSAGPCTVNGTSYIRKGSSLYLVMPTQVCRASLVMSLAPATATDEGAFQLILKCLL